MKLQPGEAIEVGHNASDFEEVVTQVRDDPAAARGTVFVLVAVPKGNTASAASELAARFGRDLYRIDLAAVVGGHVRETERNLSHLFERATAAGAMLFFDEADALFGKRTSIADAHDRYSRQDVCDLLKRIEDYDGLIVMTMNDSGAQAELGTRLRRVLVRFPPTSQRVPR
jgi:SpoVK/Ycf46/Vps4 family AAA+-type ATPase